MLRTTYVAPQAPAALGPYSSAVTFGNLAFVSAQAGVNPQNRTVPDQFEEECRQAFANVRLALTATGASLENVLKVTIMYVASADLAQINSIFEELWPTHPPARTTIIVQLAGNRRIAIDAIGAILPDVIPS